MKNEGEQVVGARQIYHSTIEKLGVKQNDNGWNFVNFENTGKQGFVFGKHSGEYEPIYGARNLAKRGKDR